MPEKPPVASLDSSGALRGVLELPGDDYFIYGGGRAGVDGCACKGVAPSAV